MDVAAVMTRHMEVKKVLPAVMNAVTHEETSYKVKLSLYDNDLILVLVHMFVVSSGKQE